MIEPRLLEDSLRTTVFLGTANLAVAKQAAVDLKGAAADMMNAHQMMAQANDFDTQAGKLQLQAQGLQLNVPGYQAAAQMATSYSGWRSPLVGDWSRSRT